MYLLNFLFLAVLLEFVFLAGVERRAGDEGVLKSLNIGEHDTGSRGEQCN